MALNPEFANFLRLTWFRAGGGLIQELAKNLETSKYTYVGPRNFHVTLIRPPMIGKASSVSASPISPPLSLASLSAILREAQVSVTNIDALGEGIERITKLPRNPTMEAQGLLPEEIIERIPPHTDLIGVSCMFSVEWPHARDIVTEIRKAFPNKLIIAGGEHVTALPQFTLTSCPALDFVVLGEGELTLLKIVDTLSQKEDYRNIPGIMYRADDGGFVQPKQSDKNYLSLSKINGVSGNRVLNLDDLPWPAWELTPVDVYLENKCSQGRYIGLTLPVLGSRGCPYDCTFCSNPTMWGIRYITRSPQDIVAEIKSYQEKYGITAVEFADLTPIIRKPWLMELCDEFDRQNVRVQWQIVGGTRCEAIDEELMVRAKSVGCAYLGFAPESGSQDVLNRIRKKVDIKRMVWLLKLAKKHKIDTRCNIIIGFPEDTRMDIFKSLAFNSKMAWLGVVDSPIFEFTPYPGSLLFQQLRDDGTIPRLDDDYFESLGGINLQINSKGFCKKISPKELALYRTLGMLVFYSIYYLTHPLKIFGFIKNIFDYQKCNSVMEQRVLQGIRRYFSQKKLQADSRNG